MFRAVHVNVRVVDKRLRWVLILVLVLMLVLLSMLLLLMLMFLINVLLLFLSLLLVVHVVDTAFGDDVDVGVDVGLSSM